MRIRKLQEYSAPPLVRTRENEVSWSLRSNHPRVGSFFLSFMRQLYKSHWLQTSRIAGQVQKFENPETLPEERFKGALFKNIIPTFLEFNVFEKIAKSQNTLFYLIKYATNIGKVDKVLAILIETIYNFRTRDQLGTKTSPFLYLTLGSFNFFQIIWRVP